jgi:RNA polymerase sigma-70 factor (ECF subfamily)
MHDVLRTLAVWPSEWRADVSNETRGEVHDDPPVPSAAASLDLADDRALVEAFVAGRREAFDVIVTRHRKSIYQLCYRFTGNHEDASDLAQDVFVKAFKALDRFKGDSALGTWLYRIGVNAALNRAALRRPHVEPIGDTEPVDRNVTHPLTTLARRDDAARVRAAIGQLPPKQRATLILRVYHELSHEEIARMLGSSVGAVKANFFHAVGNLKRLMS